MSFAAKVYICLSLLCYSAFAAAEPEKAKPVVKFGIAPFSSATNLVKTHRPLRDYLSRRLDAAVIIYTSADHETFLRDGIEGDFDLITTPPHFAPFFYEKGYIPLVKYKTPLDLIFVVRKDGNISKISDLKGKRIGIPEYLSLYHIEGLRWLNEHKKEIGGDYELVTEPGHAAAIAATAANKTDAAVTGTPPFNVVARNFVELRAITLKNVVLPPLITMANKSLGDETIRQMSDALNAFETTEEGAEFFSSLGYGGYERAGVSDIQSAAKAFRPYIEQALKDKR
ncbi:MAG: phosphate/phosphite/phosphonate ABC transporter substrate-binding protein [Helicobacteraceae bacterium]|nr:phosphate/phosphite/phosphonate ABC transporter substrate-binding protein [Helicobacteraceae bacterium]